MKLLKVLLLIYISFCVSTYAQDSSLTEIVVATPALETLKNAITGGCCDDIVQALSDPGTFTVFPPTNEAFANLDNSTGQYPSLRNTILYHAIAGAEVFAGDLSTDLKGQLVETLEGTKVRIVRYTAPFKEGVSVEGSPVVLADVDASNGVAHVIGNRVLNPNKYSVLGTAFRNLRTFSLLYLSVLRAGRATGDILRNQEGITVFAPTNRAFGRLDKLLRRQGSSLLRVVLFGRNLLRQILAYHVVPDAVAYSSAFEQMEGYNLATALGQQVTVHLVGDKVEVTDANGRTASVILADVVATNGVIHAIDEVLLPASTKRDLFNFAKRFPETNPNEEETLDQVFDMFSSPTRMIKHEKH